MHSSILRSLSGACVAVALLAVPAFAEPEAPAEEEDPDATLVQSLLGKTYDGELPIEGWTDFGGGLVSPPIYVHLYQREEDGTSLVLTSKLSSGTHEVTDALIISKPWKGYAISIACTQGDDFTLRFIGDARGPEDREWWTEVRRAWAIELPPKPKAKAETEAEAETASKSEAKAEGDAAEAAPAPGKIAKTDTKGVRCTNPNW